MLRPVHDPHTSHSYKSRSRKLKVNTKCRGVFITCHENVFMVNTSTLKIGITLIVALICMCCIQLHSYYFGSDELDLTVNVADQKCRSLFVQLTLKFR